MTAHEEAKQLLQKAWEVVFLPDQSTLDELYTDDAQISGYSPPKQTTWKGLEAIKAHFREIQPIVSSKSFKIMNLDLVQDSDSFYATFEAQFEIKIPGQEGVMDQGGIIHVVRREGKVAVWTMYEDPTPFVAMATAMAGQSRPPPT